MSKLSRVLIAACLSTVAVAPAAAQTASPTVAVASAADRQLQQLYTGYSAWVAKEYGYFEDANGETKPTDYLAHVDVAAQQRRLQYERRLLSQLSAIPSAQLSADERVNQSVLRTIIEADIADLEFRDYEMPFNSDSSFWTYLNERDRLQSAEEYRRYLARMADIPRYFREQIVNMRAGLKRGFTVPRATLEGRDASIASFTEQDVEKNPFYGAFKDMPGQIPEAEKAALRQQARQVITGTVVPAYNELLNFYRNDYLRGARPTISAHDLPNGHAYYRAQIRKFTTVDLPPEEIHQLGLKEVTRIEAAMRQTMADAGFKGTFEEFLKFLRTDPQFYAKTPDELLGVSSYVAKRVDGKLGETFGLLPRRRFTIIPVPDALAPFYTSGRGGLESCQMNTYNLPTRPLYQIPALTLHECAPGHSFQAALSEERKALPSFRRNIYFSGYGEGWGLYSEWLGYQMGIYRTPYERFGALSFEMWRAARLVIDTGIHRYGWSRDKAIAYLTDHTALSQHDVEIEVDRYISWPGQALAYKLGEMTIRRLRSEAEAQLGEKFDQRSFHDAILAMGAVPLPVLEQEMRRYIAEQKAGKIAAKPAP
ncbi:DUF885 domain-containing protein [Sphingomonas hankyongi]|uniref:DUF885 family protein n=1 Tax=Sphingomonas hankyongi TaxID=2908209 RepID=A0ABT0S1C3_9SPHN|nr:DUF885 family protein [Sphingomonas hankyongi]MCL6729663.1 DUF885 family protein [Sphingomonas hankyongi]